mmetsp:Transcript_10511/g.36301  ORF Transcript_10511/g.36301 Transcript_10511/m.36301 type:complete len:252 (-) Transcript_10511:2767-3522(-)
MPLFVFLSKRFSWMYTSWQQCLNPRVFSTHSIIPQSSVSGITAKVLMYRSLEALPRWWDLVARRWFRTFANSIILVSFLRSSLGLHKNRYSRPSLPRTLTTLGFCRELRISTSSKIWAMVTWQVELSKSAAAVAAVAPALPFLAPPAGSALNGSPFWGRASVRAFCTGRRMSRGIIRSRVLKFCEMEKVLTLPLGEWWQSLMSSSIKRSNCEKSFLLSSLALFLAAWMTSLAPLRRWGTLLFATVARCQRT